MVLSFHYLSFRFLSFQYVSLPFLPLAFVGGASTALVFGCIIGVGLGSFLKLMLERGRRGVRVDACVRAWWTYLFTYLFGLGSSSVVSFLSVCVPVGTCFSVRKGSELAGLYE